jgi:hypothetical protein
MPAVARGSDFAWDYRNKEWTTATTGHDHHLELELERRATLYII